MTALFATVIAASLVAAITDLRTRRIPNWLVVALLLCGLIENALLAGARGVLVDATLTAGVLVAGTIPFSFKFMAGGDVKLLAAAAGVLGYPAGIWFLLFALLCGGVLGVTYALLRGRLGATVLNLRVLAVPLFAGIAPARVTTGLSMPYALAILGGALCTALFSGVLPHLRLIQ